MGLMMHGKGKFLELPDIFRTVPAVEELMDL